MKAIEKAQGPCVILAGAGTGKTYTIVEKIKFLIKNKHYMPEKILCLTFSNEAVNSLALRLSETGDEKEPLIRTFHSFCADLLRKHGEKIKISRNFRILLPDDAKILLHKSFKIYPKLCAIYADTIGRAKDLGISPGDLSRHYEKSMASLGSESLEKALEETQLKLHTLHTRKNSYNERFSLKKHVESLSSLMKIKKFLHAWQAYEKIKEKKNLLDYSDLNFHALRLLNACPELHSEFEYIVVDEFQDTNKMQLDLLARMAPHRNITIVGDLNQSIYRFRGAYRNTFSEFRKVFKVSNEDIFALDKSYRSPNTVLRTAHRLILRNYEKKEDCIEVLSSDMREGKPVHVYELADEKEEVRKILEIISECVERKIPLEEICVMFRTHQQSKKLKRTLDEQKIPYSSATKSSIFSMPKIRRILNYLTLLNAEAGSTNSLETAWWELFYDAQFSREDLFLIGKSLRKNQHARKDAIEELSRLELSETGKINLARIIKNLNELKSLEKMPAENIIKETAKKVIGIAPEESAKETESQEITLNIEKLCELAREHAESEAEKLSLSEFIYHLEIMKRLGIEIESTRLEKKGIKIMTNHATKGLEYGTVICSGFVQNKFPSSIIKSDSLIPAELHPELKGVLESAPEYAKDEIIEDYERQNQLAEERRLCYVAFTRSKENLFILYAKEYAGKGFEPSQFLIEIDYLKNPDIKFTRDLEHKWMESMPAIITSEQTRPKNIKKIFSPSSLLLFRECQKKYEYKYIYNMPEPQPSSWEEIHLGSFIHKVIEHGVKNNYISESQFITLAKLMYSEEQWKSINLDEALQIIRVFFARNRKKYSSSSRTEVHLRTELDGMQFEGYADRIDFHPDGLEIIDYKTGKALVQAQHRNWQLGLYVLAAKNLGFGPVRRITLDMLRQEKPLEFELYENGTAREINSQRIFFNINDVRKELVETAKNILSCHDYGFMPCQIEKNCQFCNEWIWKV